jgi:hypothetical protein
VIAEPPLSAGALNVIVILLPLVTAATFAGADGTPAGIAVALATDWADVPTVVTTATLNVYAVPLSRPVTTQVLCPEVGLHEPASFPEAS